MVFDMKKDWPILAGVGLIGVGILASSAGGGSGSSGGGGASGPSSAELSAQTTDNQLGAQLQEAQDQTNLSEEALQSQQSSGVFSGLMGVLGSIFSGQQALDAAKLQNQGANQQLRISERYNLLQTKSDNATTLSGDKISSNFNTNTIVSNFEQQLQSLQAEMQQEQIYLEEILSGEMGSYPLNPGGYGSGFTVNLPTIPWNGNPARVA